MRTCSNKGKANDRQRATAIGENLEFLSLNPKTLGRFQKMYEELVQQAIEAGDYRLVHRIAPLMLRQVLFLTALRKQETLSKGQTP